MKKAFKLSLAVFMILSLCSCDNQRKQQKRFDKHFEKNLNTCVEIATSNSDIDDETATNICTCMLYTIFEIEPASVYMTTEEYSLFISDYFEQLYNDCYLKFKQENSDDYKNRETEIVD